ncbi:YhgE/Pip C-terminal domain protein [Sulfobacillus acidophilus DSM 10332]|uniref:YhgE/Pip C-terminal domain protein n=1 Tax=Sulfobacillus acidophilus (strain ATCC 700253 / DSM 10332 / NAL) TaxID=679936 RepID=G8TSQ1_SULAD|nr:YhgE/Pip C-terminal domain protein [Sulfobacillus acidophilus DSM 10332]
MNSRTRLVISLGAIAVVPLLYSSTYLAAFWNPYGQVDRIPVAVVNQDQGSLGRLLVRHLPSGWRIEKTSWAQAMTALTDGHVGLVMRIGPHFTEGIVHRQDPSLIFFTNPRTNYLTALVMEREATAIAGAFQHQVAVNVLHSIMQSTGRLQSASEQAAKGAMALAEAAHGIARRTDPWVSASRALAVGADVLANQTCLWQAQERLWGTSFGDWQQAYQAWTGQLLPLDGGAANLVHQLDQVAEQTVPLATTSDQLAGTAGQAAQSASLALSQTQALTRIVAENHQLVANLTASVGSGQVNAPTVEALLAQLTSSDLALETAVGQLASTQSQWATATRQIATDSQVLRQNGTSVSQGVSAVTTALKTWQGQLTDWQSGGQILSRQSARLFKGSAELSEAAGGLARGADSWARQVRSWSVDGSQLMAGLTRWQGQAQQWSGAVAHFPEALSHLSLTLPQLTGPFRVRLVSIASRETYGSGLAPYFIGLSLWVGAVVATVLIPGGSKAKAGLVRRLYWSAGLSLAQAALLVLGLEALLPFHPVHPWAFLAAMGGITLAWWILVRGLVEHLGDAGRIAAIALLVLQLAASSGTYPVRLSPGFFQVIHPWLPMTWAIHWLRYAISGAAPTTVGSNVIRLALLSGLSGAFIRWLPWQWRFEAPVLTGSSAAAGEKGLPPSEVQSL